MSNVISFPTPKSAGCDADRERVSWTIRRGLDNLVHAKRATVPYVEALNNDQFGMFYEEALAEMAKSNSPSLEVRILLAIANHEKARRALCQGGAA
jgi:hypothetical protein